MTELPQEVDSIEALSTVEGRALHLALGMFDGVHLGHQSVIDAAIKEARKDGGIAGVLTFDPHPSRILRPAKPTLLLMPVETKVRFLIAYGVDVVVRQRFNKLFSAIEAEAFVAHLKQLVPALAGLYVGQNFRYGRGRRGDVTMLEQTAGGTRVKIFSAPRLQAGGEPISSTRIRGLLEAGEVREANRLLGYRYFAQGTVIGGRKLGRTLGFPTLNVPWAPELPPRRGVYAVRHFVGDSGEPREGVANYGVRPTVAEAGAEPLLEVHSFGEPGAGPGEWLRVEWLEMLRPERKFSGPDELKAQIARDCEAARAVHAREAPGA